MNAKSIHLVELGDRDASWASELFEKADELREKRGRRGGAQPLANKTAALVFHKPSLRTRVSFTAGMHELGGDVVELSSAEISERGREDLKDVASVISEMCDLLIIRTFSHDLVGELAKHSSVPVINALTDFMHPCQVLSDLYTLHRSGKDLNRMTVSWIGDSNNVLHSWLEAATIFGFHLRICVPDGYEPDAQLFMKTSRLARGEISMVRSPSDAVRGADVVYTDTWTSMGQEEEAAWRRVAFAGYQVNDSLMAAAGAQALFMHCLPAHRGEEVTDSVMDGPQSIVIEQAANRLHLQKALMCDLVAAATLEKRSNFRFWRAKSASLAG